MIAFLSDRVSPRVSAIFIFEMPLESSGTGEVDDIFTVLQVMVASYFEFLR